MLSFVVLEVDYGTRSYNRGVRTGDSLSCLPQSQDEENVYVRSQGMGSGTLQELHEPHFGQESQSGTAGSVCG